MNRKDVPPLLFLLSVLLVQFAPVLFTGRSYFLGDLTYFFHPWQALASQLLQSGRLPLWDPYSYMGMPLLARMQPATFAPLTVAQPLFGFALGEKLHLFACHAIAGLFAYLWLRRSVNRSAAAGGALAFCLGGILLGRIGDPSHAATLAWLPAFFLFSGNVWLLALALAVSLLAGYPQMWAGLVVAALLLAGRRRVRVWVFGAGAALLLSACVLLPGLEFVRHSNRSGQSLEQRTFESLQPAEIAAVVTPLGLDRQPSGARYPVWKSAYFGVSGIALAVLGFLALRQRARAAVAGGVALVVLLALGSSTAPSLWLWDVLPPLHWVRFPANLLFLLVPVAVPLIALGLKGRRWARLAVMLMAVELLAYGWNVQPTVPDGYFTRRGPFVETLQGEPGNHRFAFSPRAALALRGRDVGDLKDRLYGSSAAAFHIRGTTGIGESVMLDGSYRVMDALFRLPDPEKALRLLPWLDVANLALPPEHPVPTLWALRASQEPARARWVPKIDTRRLDGDLDGALSIPASASLHFAEFREDRFSVIGVAPAEGSVFLAQPLYPGWEIYSPLDSFAPVTAEPAFGAFERVPAKKGQVWLEAVYRPASFRIGLVISVATLMILIAAAALRAETA